MTIARKRLVLPCEIPYYHIIARCVRRAFLCGDDPYSGQSFEHRRQWIVDRLSVLGNAFSVELCSYAIMHNHYHLVIKLNPKTMHSWSDSDVIDRWGTLFNVPHFVRDYADGKTTPSPLKLLAKNLINQWRKRLGDLSWYMRCLNEYIAVKANKEDGCTGRFWEGRFTSQGLLDQKALLACMTYVDLNPIRAAIAKTPEQSDFTAIQQRILNKPTPVLLPFESNGSDKPDDSLPFTFSDYLQLLDSTGRLIQDAKRGFIRQDLPPILGRLNINNGTWLTLVESFPVSGQRVVGPVRQLKQIAEALSRKWLCSKPIARTLYNAINAT